MKKRGRYFILFLSLAGVILFSSAGDRFFELSRQIEVFGSLYKSVNGLYVDEVEPTKLMRTFIDATLKQLDPYTVFYSGSQIERSRIEGSEKLAGIGISHSIHDSIPVITDVIKDLSADKAGLKVGDKILEIDGVSVRGKSNDDVYRALRGQADATVLLKVQKANGEVTSLELKRQDNDDTNVPFYGMLNKNTGLINLKIFNAKASEDVKNAFQELKKSNPEMNSLILDLRENPGGLLNEAVNIVNLFVERNKTVVTTKGKIKEWNSTFKTLNEPIDTKIPIVVIVNSKSASASEIVSGALQDLDRAVILGQRSFGKGLVQVTRNLPYNTGMKVTVAKYYIPSGRCVQAINYAERNPDGSVKKIPDSLKVAFKTENGRTVYDGGGVDPEVNIEPKTYATVVNELIAKHLIFDYATQYAMSHQKAESAEKFKFTEADYQDFIRFIKGRNFTYQNESEKILAKLEKASKEEKYYDAIKADYGSALKKLGEAKEAELDKNKEAIKILLESEICNRYFYAYGKYEKSLQSDPWIQKSIEILSNPKVYSDYLTEKK